VNGRKKRSGYRNLILTISPRKKNETPKRRNRVTTILATLMPSAGVRRASDVAFWRKSDNDLGARLRLIASSSDELEKARS
jgi:hypothetical protein